jgi:hypothetical protein
MTQSNNPEESEMTAEWYAELAEKQLQELLDMEAKMGNGMRKMKKQGMGLMDEEDETSMDDMGMEENSPEDMASDEEVVEPTEEELGEDEEDEEVLEPTEEELSAKKRPMPMREKGMSMPRAARPMPRAARPMPKGPMMKKKPMADAEMSPVKPLSRDELMEKLFGKKNNAAKAGVQSPKAPNPSQGKGKK